MSNIVFFLQLAIAAHADAPPPKYTAPKEMNFEQMVIEGQLKRPELAVVTGDSPGDDGGLLRLRENFKDRVADYAGLELNP